ncbi:class I SAM-dependent methyltransferase [Microvirga sp. W0021]|uniref:Class I SAM-dependent methyltransferase n=1 Tax=Hohaiivirga grylli TaxID=3133970 RepID=A0ABV0BGE0_9HYPH
MDASTTSIMQKAYARWAPIYDVLYDKLTAPAAQAAVKAVTENATRILEAGVGTGLALEYYPANIELYGVDLSADMLKRASEKVERKGLNHVKSLQVMDVCKMDFPDACFDAISAQFIITLVPDFDAAMTEFDRVLRPGGSIVLVNHFGADKGLVAAYERAVAPIVKRIGWSSDFKVSKVENWAESNGKYDVEQPQPVFPAGFFKVLRLKKHS